MNSEIIGEAIICLIEICIFIGLLCLFDIIAENLIPEEVMDKIMIALFGELPDD